MITINWQLHLQFTNHILRRFCCRFSSVPRNRPERPASRTAKLNLVPCIVFSFVRSLKQLFGLNFLSLKKYLCYLFYCNYFLIFFKGLGKGPISCFPEKLCKKTGWLGSRLRGRGRTTFLEEKSTPVWTFDMILNLIVILRIFELNFQKLRSQTQKTELQLTVKVRTSKKNYDKTLSPLPNKLFLTDE